MILESYLLSQFAQAPRVKKTLVDLYVCYEITDDNVPRRCDIKQCQLMIMKSVGKKRKAQSLYLDIAPPPRRNEINEEKRSMIERLK